ncbi:MAG: carboxylase [Salinivirgaceae bacterium]|nr:carboxylase [Salinivirgaceae bacterium]MDD4746857.1 carboxylase [Salinivirgaceae bacterium]MDY0279076.1 carboxylase [Salinivirgaceae bacterium]
MSKMLYIRDLTLRDGQQSMFATRMTQDQVERLLPLYKDANFYAMEVWGGAVPDSVMRYLNEDPWDRLSLIKKGLGSTSKLTALSRGRNLFGYNPYPEDVIEGFNRNAITSGIDIMRIFDCLNDVDNMRTTIKYVKENGGLADCALCYTVDPKYSIIQKYRWLIRGKRLPSLVFSMNYFIELAKELEKMGADILTIKDMAGLITPIKAGTLIKELKKQISIPIDFHTHCTPGFGLASTLSAIINGVDIVDTNIMTFAGGPAAPAFELIYIFCKKLGIEINVNIDAVVKIDTELREIRKELSSFDTTHLYPRQFDISKDTLPAEIDALFDKAITFAKNNEEVNLLATIHEIENWFNFDPPSDLVKSAEIPGGMYTNMLAQLKQLKLEHLLPKVLEMVPEVRIDAGCPPLVTPTSQIVGAQAVNCVIALNKGEAKYSNVSTQFHNLVKGWYGKTPIEIDRGFRYTICGHSQSQDFDVSSYEKPANSVLCFESETCQLADNEKEMLLLELFPSVATGFLRSKKENEMLKIRAEIEDEQQRALREKRKRYESLTPEQKRKRLEKGLMGYSDWGSIEDHPDIRTFEEEQYKRNKPDTQN